MKDYTNSHHLIYTFLFWGLGEWRVNTPTAFPRCSASSAFINSLWLSAFTDVGRAWRGKCEPPVPDRGATGRDQETREHAGLAPVLQNGHKPRLRVNPQCLDREEQWRALRNAFTEGTVDLHNVGQFTSIAHMLGQSRLWLEKRLGRCGEWTFTGRVDGVNGLSVCSGRTIMSRPKE